MKPWTEILLKPGDTLEKAIQVLHAGGNRIALVVDDIGKLQGTVTDGDIRRALIKHLLMDSPVSLVMNANPATASVGETRRAILSRMRERDLIHMPIIDPNGKLEGLETLQTLVGPRLYDNPVFLMAGGFGTRLHPLTKETPKPMLTVGDRPILETILSQLIDAGFRRFFISTHYKAEIIRDYFGDGSGWGVQIEYIHEDEPLGTAGGLGLLPRDMLDLPMLVMNGDLLTKVNFDHLIDFHHQQGGIATVCVREYDYQVPFGVVTTDGQCATAIIEKPVHKFFVNAGIYVLERALVQQVSGKIQLDMPTLLGQQIGSGRRVTVYPLHEYWLDIGRMEEFERAHNAYRSEF